jgi:hypothetical protein
MPNLAFQLAQLTAADEHIAAAERRIAQMHLNIAREREMSGDTELSEAVLHSTEDALQLFQKHRSLIHDAIEGIRSGALPDL